VVWPTTGFVAAIPTLTNWKGAKRLILSGANDITTNLDLSSGKGKLEIGNGGSLSIGNATLTGAGGDTGNITVAEGGSIVLTNAGATLAGTIEVDGAISMGNITLTNAIPTTVHLENGALQSTGDTAVFKLAASAWEIGALNLDGALTIAEVTTNLTVGRISNTTASVLTLPGIPVSVTRIETHSSATLTVAGAAGTTLLAGTVATGTGGLTLGANVVVGNITDLTANSKIGITTFATHFPLLSDLASKVTGPGTVDVDSQALLIESALTFKARIETDGLVTVKANTAFNHGLTATAGVTNAAAGTPVTLTLGGDLTGALTAAAAGLTLTGTNVAISGAVTATEGLTVTGTVAFNNSDNIMPTGKSLTVGTGAAVKAGNFLTFGPGTYIGDGTGSFTYGANVLKSTANNDDALYLGNTTTGIKLGGTVLATNIFTASGATVILSGLGDGSITVPASGVLTFGTTADLALGTGDGVVALGNVAGGTGGKLALADVATSRISGFGAGSTLLGPNWDGSTFKSGNYSSGLITTGTGAFGSNAVQGNSGYVITGALPSGGVLTKDSAVGSA
jgi:hypothetical protein